MEQYFGIAILWVKWSNISVLRYCGLNGAGVSLKRQHIIVSALLNLHHSQSETENTHWSLGNTLIIQTEQMHTDTTQNIYNLHLPQLEAAYTLYKCNVKGI